MTREVFGSFEERTPGRTATGFKKNNVGLRSFFIRAYFVRISRLKFAKF